MQKTGIDHALKDKFCCIYEISCNRMPKSRLPYGVSFTIEQHRHGVNQWAYKIRCNNQSTYFTCINMLRSERALFHPSVTEKHGVLSNIISPKDGSSFTFNSIWTGLKMAVVSFFTYGLHGISSGISGAESAKIAAALLTRGK